MQKHIGRWEKGGKFTSWDFRSDDFFLLPQDIYFRIKDGGASENAVK